MTKYFFTLSLFLVTDLFSVSGQEIASIQTDRPDQTECPFTVPKNHFQVENGFSFEQTDDHTKTFSHPSTLLKFGVTDLFELRLITEFTAIYVNKQAVSGIAPVTIGFKTNLVKEKGIIPLTSFIGHLTISDCASPEFQSTYYAPSFRFTMQHTLSGKFTLGYNLGAEWNGESAEPTFIYTLTTGYAISEKTGSYVELYGFVPQTSIADHRFDAGLNYLLKKNILIDISGGVGLSENSPDYYAALGFSFRLKD